MISARGEVRFQIVEGNIHAERFIGFLDALIEGASRKIFLVVDNLRVPHATMVTDWLADRIDRMKRVFLPPYAPESHPDESLNRHFKTALRTGPVSPDKQSLLDQATAFMKTLSPMPETVRACFRHPAAAYAIQCI
jgi:hypothetical protein